MYLEVEKLPHAFDLPLPFYATAGSAGLDLCAALHDALQIPCGASACIATGLKVGIPHNYEGQIRSRSGLALRHSVVVLNSPGTIDSDYRGEIMILLINHGTEAFTVTHGMRIAQLVIAPVVQVTVQETTHLTETDRGHGGFGSTGYHHLI